MRQLQRVRLGGSRSRSVGSTLSASRGLLVLNGAGISLVPGPDWIAWMDVQRTGKPLKHRDGRRDFGALDRSEVAGREPGAVGQFLLRQFPARRARRTLVAMTSVRFMP
jgi:hypothetical protein